MKINKKTKVINEELIKEATLREDEDSNTEVSPDGEVSVTTETENGITTTTVELPLDSNGNPATKTAEKYAHNAITDALDKAYRKATWKKGMTSRGYNTFGSSKNVLIIGLPGSSKTASVKGWAKAKGLECYQLDVRDSELEVTLNGAPFFEKSEDGKKTTISKAASDALNRLDAPNGSILFLDELNRQLDHSIRGTLLKLVAEKAVLAAGYPDGIRPFPNLLFAVAAINPYDPTDEGVSALDDAEKRRYNIVVEFNSTTEGAEAFVEFSYHENLMNCVKEYADPKHDPDEYLATLKGFIYGQDLAMHILNYPGFKFDTNVEAQATKREHKTLFNQATFTDTIFDAGEIFAFNPKTTVAQYTKQVIQDFKEANLLKNTFTMIKAAIDQYRPSGDFKALVEAQEKLWGVDLGSKEIGGIGGNGGNGGNGGTSTNGGDTEDTPIVFGGGADDMGTGVKGATESPEDVEDTLRNFFSDPNNLGE